MLKIYKEIVCIKKLLQAIYNSPEQQESVISENSINRIILYANNEIYRQELRISLSSHDWYKLQNQSFYQELMKYLDNLQIQKI